MNYKKILSLILVLSFKVIFSTQIIQKRPEVTLYPDQTQKTVKYITETDGSQSVIVTMSDLKNNKLISEQKYSLEDWQKIQS